MEQRHLSILHLFSYHLYTGPAEPILNLARAQRRLGHDARIAIDTHRAGDLAPVAERFGVPVERQFALSVKSGPILLLRDLLAFKRLWNQQQVDVVHAHRSHDHTLAAMARPRRSHALLVRSLHTERSSGQERSWQLDRADGLVTVARRFRAQLVERGLLDPERIIAVEGAVDPDRFCPGPGGECVRSEANVLAHQPVAGIVARMKDGRGYRLLLRAWKQVVKRLPDACLMIAGRGEIEAQVRRLAQPIPDRQVVFLGYRRDLPEVYRSFDLKVILAPGNDGTCRAALEAMASGVPVLASDQGALAEIVDHGRTGWVVPGDDPRAWAEVLCQALSDRARLAAMGHQARTQAANRFRVERQTEEIEGLYRHLMELRARALQ